MIVEVETEVFMIRNGVATDRPRLYGRAGMISYSDYIPSTPDAFQPSILQEQRRESLSKWKPQWVYAEPHAWK